MTVPCNNPVKFIVKSFGKHQYVYLESRTAEYNCWSNKRDKYVNGQYAINDKELCYYLKEIGLEFSVGAFDVAEGQNPCDLPLCYGELSSR